MKTIIAGLLASLLVLCSLSASANEIELLPIAPDHVGLTVQKSPVLYFYISQATSLPIRFTLFDNRKVPPLVDVRLRSPTRPGYWAIRLEDYGVVLEEEVQYRWYVQPDLLGKEYFLGGVIERIGWLTVGYIYDGPSCDKDAVRFLMKAGIWYDGFACLNELIEANPEDRSLRVFRRELLKQIGVHLLDAN